MYSCKTAIQLAYGTSRVLLWCQLVPEIMQGGTNEVTLKSRNIPSQCNSEIPPPQQQQQNKTKKNQKKKKKQKQKKKTKEKQTKHKKKIKKEPKGLWIAKS